MPMLLRAAPPEPIRLQTTALSAGVVLALLPEAEDGHDPLPELAVLRAPPFGTVAVRHDDRARRLAALRVDASGERSFVSSDLEIGDLAGPLDAASRHRLLSFLLGFCRSAFRLGQAAGFASTCRRLAEQTLPCHGTATPLARLAGSMVLLRGVRAPAGAPLHMIGERATFPSLLRGAGEQPGGSWGGLQVVEQHGPGSLLLVDGEHPGYWLIDRPDADLPHVLQLVEAGGPGAAELRIACLAALLPHARPGTPEAALLHDLQLLAPLPARVHDDPAQPMNGALELALSDTNGHLFLRGWLRDPLALVDKALLLTVSGATELSPDALHRVSRPDLGKRPGRSRQEDPGSQPGFVALVPDPSGGHTRQPQLQLQLRSGASVLLTPQLRSLCASEARDAVLGSVGPAQASASLLDACIAPAASALHRAALRGLPTAEVLHIGSVRRSPALSILVPLYRNLGFLRFQVAALARDPDLEGAELVLALDSPEQRVELEHLLRGLHTLHGLPFTLVVMARNAGFAAASNAAAAAARAPVLLLLNSDVVPSRPGWASCMAASLRRSGVGAVGPKLLFDDESIQHAGLFFERDADGVWFNQHYHKGMPRHWGPACVPRLVPGVTGGALMLRASTFAALGGIDEDYIIGDYEDSDLCLRLQARGERIAYAPAAELFHFERRSIRLHEGYGRTLAATVNRRLHHRRWDAAMEALMRAHTHHPARKRA